MSMAPKLARRTFLKSVAGQGLLAATAPLAADAKPAPVCVNPRDAWIQGKMTVAKAIVLALQLEGTRCVFGIPGAQMNELWDTFKESGLDYLLVTHELSASGMADGAARSTGQPGVLCIVPGPGITNALTGIGEALLDSIPLVCVVGDIGRGEAYKPFQVHDLDPIALLGPVTKEILHVCRPEDAPGMIRTAFSKACAGEPGPVAVVIPYNLFAQTCEFSCPPAEPPSLPFDEDAYQAALAILQNSKKTVGIYAGLGVMDHSELLAEVASLLDAPVTTSVSGKGVIPDGHPLAVGWGYGPQGTEAAEKIFKKQDILLAIGVRGSEVATGMYSNPTLPCMIHVDANADNLGKAIPANVCVHADSGLFLSRLLGDAACIQRPGNPKLLRRIAKLKQEDRARHERVYAKCGVDPMLLLLELRKQLCDNALVFVDVTQSEHWAAEAFDVRQPRTYFNPTDNQSMGWSIPAALGAQQVNRDRTVVAVVGDGCFLMSAMEISTAARAHLPVKFFVLDDQAYHYMQTLQKAAYQQTTATVLARLDYAALATGFGVGYEEILLNEQLPAAIATVLARPEPVLCRVTIDYGKRPVRWINATKQQYIAELSTAQKARFLARLGARSVRLHEPGSD